MRFGSIDELKDRLREIARDCEAKGPGYAQEGVVLREARRILAPQTLADERMILEAWHRLFHEGELEWGFDLDNPGAPFFHHPTTAATGVK
jgi:hypothetical protein